jgi:hypothetical protein
MRLQIEKTKLPDLFQSTLSFSDDVADKPATDDRASPSPPSPAMDIDELIFIKGGVNPVEDLGHEFRGGDIEIPDGPPMAGDGKGAIGHPLQFRLIIRKKQAVMIPIDDESNATVQETL